MSAVVVDTHTTVWYLSTDSRLSTKATAALDLATANGERIYVPSLCRVELTYLVEKGRLPAAARDWLIQAIDDKEGPFVLTPLDRRVVNALEAVRRLESPDLPDWIIAATAIALRSLLISSDQKIRASQVQTLW